MQMRIYERWPCLVLAQITVPQQSRIVRRDSVKGENNEYIFELCALKAKHPPCSFPNRATTQLKVGLFSETNYKLTPIVHAIDTELNKFVGRKMFVM